MTAQEPIINTNIKAHNIAHEMLNRFPKDQSGCILAFDPADLKGDTTELMFMKKRPDGTIEIVQLPPHIQAEMRRLQKCGQLPENVPITYNDENDEIFFEIIREGKVIERVPITTDEARAMLSSSQYTCVKCGAVIPPGKPGRKCLTCRGAVC